MKHDGDSVRWRRQGSHSNPADTEFTSTGSVFCPHSGVPEAFAHQETRLSDFARFATRNSSFDVVAPRWTPPPRMNLKSAISNLRPNETWRASHAERVPQREKKPEQTPPPAQP